MFLDAQQYINVNIKMHMITVVRINQGTEGLYFTASPISPFCVALSLAPGFFFFFFFFFFFDSV